MEPADVTPVPPDDRELEALLRRRPAPLPDDGFSRRVLHALPTPIPHELPRAQWRVILVGAVAGLGFAIAGLLLRPGQNELDTFVAATRSLAQLGDPIFLIAVAVTGLSLAYVFRSRLRFGAEL